MVDPVPACVVMDLEGVLVPEIWISVAERTGIDALRRTTRDEPDYDRLMRYRLEILDRHGLRLTDIQAVISDIEPCAGACDLVVWLRERVPFIILSDTFDRFAGPLMRRLGQPTLFCNQLEVDGEGRVIGYRLRQPDQKRCAVEALRGLCYRVMAFGDSFNDTSMLRAADRGVFFRPSPAAVAAFPDLPVVDDYAGVEREVTGFIDDGGA